MGDEARFACDGCGKKYRWKQELAGKRVKCGCGSVMTVPATMVVVQVEEDIYGLSEDTAPPPKPKPAAPRPVAAKHVGAPRAAAKSVARPVAKAASAPIVEREISSEPDSPSKQFIFRRKGLTQEKHEEAKPSVLIDTVLPIVLIVIGVGVCFLESYTKKVNAEQPIAGVLAISLGGMVLSLVFMLGAMVVAAAIGGVAFSDPIPVTILKICAAGLAPGAAGALVDQWVGGINGNIFGSLTAVALYFGLFALLFRMSMQDKVVCVMLVWIIRVAVAYGMYRLEEFKSGSWI